MAVHMVIAGFGGQGVLFTGKVIANAGMLENKQVSWLPSYGPEMRGGTANCSVCIDTAPIGCPIVLEPETLLAMNRPSYEKFIQDVAAGGTVIYDSSLIEPATIREDITTFPIPATAMATESGMQGLSNIILLGQTLKAIQFTEYRMLEKAMEKSIPASKQHLLEPNLKALRMGYEY